MKSVLVLGAGTMGSGIAQVFAQAGFKVFLRDIEINLVEKGLTTINKNLERLVNKGKLTLEDKQEIIGRIKGIVNIEEAQNVDLVVEGIVENIEVKKKVFAELDEIFPANTIFATNTSSLSITDLAAVTKRPEKVIGMHFFNPVPVMQLVEVIKGVATSEETYQTICDLVRQLGKTPVTVNEAPGFVVNRLLIPMINEAAYLLMEGVATAEDIDTAMRLGANHPMGPLALADLIGLDVCLAIMETLHKEFGDDKYRPCPLLRKMVRAGHLGRKTQRGFYQYTNEN
ncbi:3-hydroxybutyryl-CoA dehydrogenase [Carboxydothermus hydrogenoformans]|uniref:3-hydroxybutyryl-CoA dehydrogenase n=1 Tax=Carboxydothermus hydrogenoformans (strain ATCC BAA-161 / DSM 6008 / Z-2901) TaxID=246194 RepID=Q3ACK8_CARHZ|nr:3-hydroxybutyryl-CoA dehydrogenase [Carboxydothermus hydrogenoformans]ABB15412.1 3-hydroxybutyryl-CoA dehydrogenase [Carboxydothermus hydrogenoformans Z-2901]